MAAAPPYPLYDRSYALYRLSPLHHGHTPLLDPPSLRAHARRLKEQLKGDSVRGVEVALAAAEGATPERGALEQCQWQTIGDEVAWIDLHNQPGEPATPEQARGVAVLLEYEKQSYNALLLRDPAATTSPDAFTSLPLLLVKMPAPMRDVFLNYLRTTFDAHVAPLRLSSAFLASSLESYFGHLSASTSSQSILDVVQKLQLQLTFPHSNTLLKHMDISIAPPDVARFVGRGKLLPNSQQKPFTSAISCYLREHLALDLSHPKIHISRISCQSFQLSTDRIRLGPPDISGDISFSQEEEAPEGSASQLAMEEFYASLIREATGTGKFLPENLADEGKSSTPSSNKSAKGGRRKRAISNTATPSARPKRPKARGKENGRRRNRDEEMADA
ncbi:hypothetical protein K505DRAFT_343016 [Melanomma pulvis-pyrius CBS 109.77]|uniref:Kinetochore complex Sim4 subunit Fta1-domain-containing protein n=1 Tax=Melanomma pulvis-pyrius CBS 109.77 TaxID=1314802 RepID=A0A6A6WTX9_9PLEO|nr:hypothetical protein K505DRAFT_343016 [Melanomma pulvis-pyrius CBS 109.77]